MFDASTVSYVFERFFNGCEKGWRFGGVTIMSVFDDQIRQHGVEVLAGFQREIPPEDATPLPILNIKIHKGGMVKNAMGAA